MVTDHMEETGAFFDSLAGFYDAEHEALDIGDAAFYVDLARDADGPVLEIGCGTGRVYLELLAAGVDADGIDVSAEMLDVLEAKAAERGHTPTVRQADMTDFDPEREYALVIVPYRTFLHNTTLSARKRALRNIYDALEAGGTLALNFFVPSFEFISEYYGTPETRTVTKDGDEYVVTEVSRIVDEVNLVAETEQTIERDGEVVETAAHRLALVSKSEFELLLETTGWSEWTAYGGFDREPLDDGSREMVWVVEK